jgi:hypothetical protein
MATYLESLMGDRERLNRALTAQIEAEAARVRDLQGEVATYAAALDQQIVRLLIYRGLYGVSSQDTLSQETEVEEVSKPHTAALQELALHQRVLQGLQEALIRLTQGQSLEATASGESKLTVADILES